jgi:hypothetical protein
MTSEQAIQVLGTLGDLSGGKVKDIADLIVRQTMELEKLRGEGFHADKQENS